MKHDVMLCIAQANLLAVLFNAIEHIPQRIGRRNRIWY